MATKISPPFDAYDGKEPYVFVSYSHDDSDIVFKEIKRLHVMGYRIWYDDGIVATSEFSSVIEKQLEGCSLFLVFITARSRESEYVKDEINYAIIKNKTFLYVSLENVKLPEGMVLRMSRLQGILKFQLDENTYFKKLIKGIPDELRDKDSTDGVVSQRSNLSERLTEKRSISQKHIGTRSNEPAPISETFQSIVSNETTTNDSFALIENEWVSGTAVELKLVGTSAKEHLISKKKSGDPMNLLVSGSLAFLPTYDGMRAFDISDPRSPKLISLFPVPYIDTKWFELIGEIGLLRGRDASIRVIDYKDPTNPKEVFFENYHRNIFNNCGNGLLVYNKNIVIDLCHSENCGVKVLDFSDRQEVSKNVREIGVVHFSAGSGALFDDYLILGNYKDPQLRIVRLREEEVVEIKTVTVEFPDGCLVPGGIVSGNRRLYVFGKDFRTSRPLLAVYSLENFPEELESDSCYELPLEHTIKTLFGVQVYISDDWLYYNDSGRLFVYDISQPTQPRLGFAKDGLFYVAHISGNMMFCGDDRNIWIFDMVRKTGGPSANKEAASSKDISKSLPSPVPEIVKVEPSQRAVLLEQAQEVVADASEVQAERVQTQSNSERFLFATNDLAFTIGAKDSKVLSFSYLPGTPLQYAKKGMDDKWSGIKYSMNGWPWYQLPSVRGKEIWLTGWNATFVDSHDNRVFFKISETGQVGYLLDYAAGGTIEEIAVLDNLLGEVKIRTDQIISMTAKKNEMSIETKDIGCFTGGLRKLGNYDDYRFLTMGPCLVTRDAVIALVRTNRTSPLTIKRIAEVERPSLIPQQVYWDTSLLKFLLQPRAIVGHFDKLGYDGYIQFVEKSLGWMRISIPEIRRITVDLDCIETPVVVETSEGSVYRGTCPEQFNLSGTMISFDKVKNNLILEAFERKAPIEVSI